MHPSAKAACICNTASGPGDLDLSEGCADMQSCPAPTPLDLHASTLTFKPSEDAVMSSSSAAICCPVRQSVTLVLHCFLVVVTLYIVTLSM